jgi:hypothetical protein
MSEQLVPAVPPHSRRAIESFALAFVKKWAPGRLETPGAFPVYDVFESFSDKHPDIITGVDNLPDGVEGMCWPNGRVLLSESTYQRLVTNEGRARFTTIHELCHALYHCRYLKQALIETGGRPPLYRRSTVPAFRDPEWQANVFASTVLMPADAVVKLAEQTNPFFLPYAMQSTFGVSSKAAEIQISLLRERGLL